jgi:HD-GYP domain-containing protein (c-di-GMP phosphodiesterase class II)
LLASSSSDNNIATNEAVSSSTEAERLRQIANQLRAEADAAEKQLEPTRQQKQPPSSLPPVECFDINDSCWELTYRFANEPIVEEDEQMQDDDEKRQQRKVYSGKVKLKFKSDGYTTNLSSSSSQQQQQTGDIAFQKVWGWDIETSDQDSYNYILFSADIITGTESERFYFQARVDDDRQTGALQLNDGSVTVKRDIKLPGAGGFWGIFGGADKILAQFRAVGEFRCKPMACDLDE